MITAEREPLLPEGAGDILRRRLAEASGLALIAAAAAVLTALYSYNPGDPSLNNATAAAPHNFLGVQGAYIADLMLQSFGLAGCLPALALTAWGYKLLRKRPVSLLWLRLTMLTSAVILLAMSLSLLTKPPAWPMMAGLGGVTGGVLMERVIAITHTGGVTLSWMVFDITAILGISALVSALGFSVNDWRAAALGLGRGLSSLFRFLMQSRDAIAALPLRQGGAAAVLIERGNINPPSAARSDLVTPRLRMPKAGKRARAASQGTLDLSPDNKYSMPPLDLLEAPLAGAGAAAITCDALQQNARLLETVLEDFGVSGEITKVRPGPVVTLYELEPAPGTKTSRVIGLSDDIARSMSAVAVRVAVVPGRNAIGIELPNVRREMVHLRELVASEDFEQSSGKLPLALGKDISGAPVLVDLTRMPHLLIAGTTGAGKSVAINTMILSILYKQTPEECRLIMIDPKMLELSVYEGIPHLLSPVVTEPSKAVVALKWAVREMEERYRVMSQLGVRNIAGYNARLAEARKKGEILTRRVQTGFDDQGKPLYEEHPLSMEALPFIVIIVDEMADLMLVAGKDIEAAVQRLAQMARAAGIHVIMATQRPSVDVITGTIKANFPTRVSFQVTSKIDSRTILGEQGAEQLLGQGDMLYMAGGGRIMRVHGPFVSDQEVEAVVSYLKLQGAPSYIEAITEEEDDIVPAFDDDSPLNDTLYEEARALVAREGKASTSFIQRHLQIGYNRAARIIERMEAENLVSKANRVGRREVLIGQNNPHDH
ncbi:MAG: cell division protein FtsK [Rhodospirillales bacterium RIFCSPLOWO2_12_FULL_58_28]|nr:MAG: cell division protein FtsK [Rhodospirillales bacterium RIFCSPLOWO2_02_FULL_58_16]OHC77401.1 MAG: cell division protein FtsK [Rhodospirillales bacterium RIFCSPLOWO2_12_FULL_58_28]